MSSATLTQTRAAVAALGVDMGAPHREEINGNWRTLSRRPTLEDFRLHWGGQKVMGHTTGAYVHVVSLDLDAHAKKGQVLLPGERDRILSEKYSAVVIAFGVPSLVVRTREGGGLHCYWWLEKKMPFLTLKARITDRVPGVEVLPTPRHDGNAGGIIRTPGAYACGGHLLDPVTLFPLPIAPGAETEEAIVDASTVTVTLERFLGLTKEMARELFRHGKASLWKMRKGLRLASWLERAASGITQGHTNEKITEMVRACVWAGHDAKASHVFIRGALDASGVTLDDETLEPKLEKRVRSLHAKCKGNRRERAAALLRPGDPTLFTDARAIAIVEKVRAFYGPGAVKGRRLGTLRMVALSLVRSVEKVRSLSEKDLRLLDGTFPGFYHKVKRRGLVPLPRNLWRHWVKGHRDSWYRGALLATGTLSPGWLGRSKGSGYCPGGQGFRYRERAHGVCRYFAVNFEV